MILEGRRRVDELMFLLLRLVFVLILLVLKADAFDGGIFENVPIKSSRVEAFSCSRINTNLQTIKTLSKRNILIRLNIIDDKITIPRNNFIHDVTFVVDLGCQGINHLLKNAEQELLLNAPYTWFLIDFKIGENDCDDFIRFTPKFIDDKKLGYISDLKILPDSNVNIIFRDKNGKLCPAISVYKRNESQALVIDESVEKPLATRRINLQQALIRICYVLTNNDTLYHLSDYKNKEIDTITKVNYFLTNHLLDFLNASRSFTYVSSWGYKDSGDDSWSGMIGQLTRNEADVGGSPLFFTADRISVIDYIAMPTPTRSKFVFRQPKLSYMSNVFILPFKGGVWGCSLGLVLVLSVFLFASSKWEWIHFGGVIQNDSDSETLRPSWSDVFIMTFGAICQQGSNVQLKSPVGRIVILLLFLSLMFLYTSYSANIVALLQSSSSRIKTLPDLLNSRLKMAVHDTVFNRHYFSTATEPIRKAIYRKKIAIPGEEAKFISLEDGVKKLRGGLFAFHMETGVGYKVVGEVFLESEKCGLQEIQYLQVIDPWLAVQKNSSYKEMFKIGFRRIQEHGLQTRENWLFYTKRPKCAGTGNNFISVGIVDCRPAMMVLAYGGLFSIILLVLEKLKFYKCRRQIQNI